MLKSDGGEEVVCCASRQRNIFCCCINIQECAKAEKNKIHKHQHKTECEYILLCFTDVLAGNIFLHHLLVKPGHGNGDKHAAKEMFRQESFHLPVAHNYFRIGRIFHRSDHISESEIHLPADEHYRK